MQLSIDMKDNLRLWVHHAPKEVPIEDRGWVAGENGFAPTRDIIIGDITITMFEEALWT